MGGYAPNPAPARAEMLAALGLDSAEALFSDIPDDLRLKRPLNLPPGKSEMETLADMREIAGKNTVFRTLFRGAGAYRHYIPAIVRRVAAKEEFVTAYTPYQPELSQGALQAIFEYQTMICELTGMDAANASVYDGASAAAEAVSMCVEKGRGGVLMSAAVHPRVIETVRTYCAPSGTRPALAPLADGATDPGALESMINADTACVYIQHPNFYGRLENVRQIGEMARSRGVRLIVGSNPIALAALEQPGAYGADVAVGDGQPLGLSLSFGGPYLGFIACRREFVRRLPGRIVGETVDRRGGRAFVLTLQTREQHIKREKASSNICTNQALCALTAGVYMSAMGYAGMRAAAELSMSNARYLKDRLSGIDGFEPVFSGPFFHEFVTRCPIPPDRLERLAMKHGILPGLPLNGDYEGCILWCATECNDVSEIGGFAELAKEWAKPIT